MATTAESATKRADMAKRELARVEYTRMGCGELEELDCKVSVHGFFYMRSNCSCSLLVGSVRMLERRCRCTFVLSALCLCLYTSTPVGSGHMIMVSRLNGAKRKSMFRMPTREAEDGSHWPKDTSLRSRDVKCIWGLKHRPLLAALRD